MVTYVKFDNMADLSELAFPGPHVIEDKTLFTSWTQPVVVRWLLAENFNLAEVLVADPLSSITFNLDMGQIAMREGDFAMANNHFDRARFMVRGVRGLSDGCV